MQKVKVVWGHLLPAQPLLTGFVLVIIFLVSGCAPHALTPAPEEEVISAHVFRLAQLDGETPALTDFHGRWVIVNFWATWCLPCRDEMPYLQDLSQRFPKRLTVIGINQREDAAVVRAFVTELQINFPILLHPDDETLLAYQVMGLPRTAIVDPEGRLEATFTGPLDDNPRFQAWLDDHFSDLTYSTMYP